MINLKTQYVILASKSLPTVIAQLDAWPF